jgi:hypothetical protein
MWIIYIVFLALVILVLYTLYKVKELKFIQKKINKCIDNMEDLFEIKEMYINEIIKKKKNAKLSDKMFNYRENKTIFDKENVLFGVNWDILSEYPDLIKDEAFTSFCEYIEQTNEGIDGLKDFYNINVNKFNNLFSKKPFSLIYKTAGFERGKMFILRKLNEYEIEKD